MNIDEYVMEFVENARYIIPDEILSESEQNRLKIIFDDCMYSILKEYKKEFMPVFIICNTYNKYSTILPVRLSRNQYKYYLLYDRHLSRINGILNALYFDENDSAHDIWKLSYELFAEDSLLNNKDVLTVYYGLNKAALGSFEVNEKGQIHLEFFKEIQERYVIGHELGHWIYKISGDENAKDIIHLTFDEDWLAFLDNIKLLLCELYEEYGKRFQEKEYTELIHEQSMLVNKNDTILEECFADAVAYAMTFSYVQEKYPDDLKKRLLAAQALFLVMMNLQLLAMQQMAISEESFESSTSIRIGFLRNYAGLYFEGDEKIFETVLVNTVERYETRITNPMLECFSVLEDRADNIHAVLADTDGLLDINKIVGLAGF